MPIQVEFKKDGEVCGVLLLSEKKFKTGSDGYFGNGQGYINGHKVQLQAQAVVVGSRKKAGGK